MHNPFHFGGKITVPTGFIGRSTELKFITQRMQGAQTTSVGIVGPRRIGKSSLLYHLYQTHPQILQDPARFLVAYSTLQDIAVRTQKGLAHELGSQLARARDLHTNAALLPPWPDPCTDLGAFRQGLRSMTGAGLRPVLCLDEFEALLEDRNEFDNRFYDGLRAMMDDQVLMLIIASARPLDYYSGRYRAVSRFPNITATLVLEEFSEEEVDALLCLPAVPNGTPALSAHDRALARELGGQHPFFLQMAASYIYTANTENHSEDWVRKQFWRQSAPHRRVSSRVNIVVSNVIRSPSALGRGAKWFGAKWDTVNNCVIGVVVMAIVLLVLLRVIRFDALICFLQQITGLSQGSCS